MNTQSPTDAQQQPQQPEVPTGEAQPPVFIPPEQVEQYKALQEQAQQHAQHRLLQV